VSELATVPGAAVVVEERYSRLSGLPFVQPGFVADLLARVQVRWPSVPVFFAETRPMAEEWTFRFVGACLAEKSGADRVAHRLAGLVGTDALPPAAATPAQLRAWALGQGVALSSKGRVAARVVVAYEAAHLERRAARGE
jgi:hypothetical protein